MEKKVLKELIKIQSPVPIITGQDGH